MHYVLLSNDMYSLLIKIAQVLEFGKSENVSIDEALVYSIETAYKSVKEEN